ncbi:MAG: sugar phosphate nucleotidyltransferase [Syntrophaceae bacterium]|nr:sugar phosphate nucleotidyltransferase [Syntrophaceae bacterium]
MITKIPITAFILAGGIGSRLKPVVWDRPKPLAPIGQKPFLEILINSILRKGIQSIVLLTGFMSEQIEDFVLKYSSGDINLVISREERPLGTGGAVKNAQAFATDPTLLVNGDTYFEADIAGLYNFHGKNNADVTLSLCKVPDVGRYGSVIAGPRGIILDFQEKSSSQSQEGFINAGFSMMSYSRINKLPDGKAFSMEKDVFPSLVNSRLMYGLEQQGVFFDIGTPESYTEFAKYIEKREKKSPRT